MITVPTARAATCGVANLADVRPSAVGSTPSRAIVNTRRTSALVNARVHAIQEAATTAWIRGSNHGLAARSASVSSRADPPSATAESWAIIPNRYTAATAATVQTLSLIHI